MKINPFLTFLLIIFSLDLYAQRTDHSEQSSGSNEHHQNELAIANSPVYFLKGKELAYGLHVHYIRYIQKSKFGIGLGYERIFDEHKHNTFGVVGSYRPVEKLSFNISPGLTFEDINPEIHFALHLETSYEFEIKDIHIGPVIEFAYDPKDLHLSLGIHIAYGF